jgi:PEP-CTERM motif-containing protein
MSKLYRTAFSLCAGLLLVGAGYAHALSLANVIDLRTSGSSETTGIANGALFYQNVDQSSGTGFINPFLRIQDSPVEEGFNTDYRQNGQAPLDDKSDLQFTHSLTLGSLKTVTVNNTSYYLFSLDIDEPNNGPKRYISLDEVKLYLASAPDLSDLSSATLKWDMDGAGDAVVYLDGGALSPGNGGDDMQMLVPTSFFAGADPNSYLYFYTKMGATAGFGADNFDADASFEEWRALQGEAPPPPPVPEPATMLLLGGGLAGVIGKRRGLMRK